LAFDVQNKRVTVAGAARSGLAAAELLVRRGARVTLSETRRDAPETEPLRRLGVQLELGGHQSETFTDADLVVLSPGVPPETPVIEAARARGIPVIAEIELASRWLQGRVIAITGTKGKSTTTALTGRMLEAATSARRSARRSATRRRRRFTWLKPAAFSSSRSTRFTRGSR
jgi:UDP-N-acetylmuramoylalanine--D-glutamate ligase